MLLPGDPVPLFTLPTAANPNFVFDTAAGRWLVLCFHGSAARPDLAAMLDRLRADALFDDTRAACFAVALDAGDRARVAERVPGFRVFVDADAKVSARFGICTVDAATQQARLTATTFVIDPMLRVLAAIPVADPAGHAQRVLGLLRRLPGPAPRGPARQNAPVLVVPRLFEPELCRALIAHYRAQGGEDSGFMRNDAAGRTVGVIDHAHKRRRDCLIADETLRAAIRTRIERRLVPEIRKAFQYEATVVERYIVACYDAGEGGYFRPHRDNTTRGTAHRRFAVTINLNAEEYEGGELRFPEYDQRHHKAPTGGAVVFSCSILHEALPVRTGTRYAVLPFLYDAAAAKLRDANRPYLVENA